VHRAILGSVERFTAILIEHLGGKWPFWLSPRQIIVCPISEKAFNYCESVYLYFHKLGYECVLDRTQGQINKKIRNAQLAQWNYILVAGEDEMEMGCVDVRTRDNKRHGKMRIDDVAKHLESLKPEASSNVKTMYAKAWNPEDFPRLEPHQVLLKELEKKLTNKTWLGGAQPSKADAEARAKVEEHPPSVKEHPNVFGWWSLVNKFTPQVLASWKDAEVAAKPEEKKEAAPKKGGKGKQENTK